MIPVSAPSGSPKAHAHVLPIFCKASRWRPMYSTGFPANLIQAKALSVLSPYRCCLAPMEWPTSTGIAVGITTTAGPSRRPRFANRNRFDGWTRGRRPSTRFIFGRWPRNIIGAAVKQCACPGGGDANGTGARRSVALDIGNAVDRRAAHLPCATALARAGSGANRDVYRCHRGASCFPHTVGDVGGCEREGRVGRRLHPVCDLAGAAPVSDY